MNEELAPSARRVADALRAHGFAFDVVELPASTRTAAEAAAAIGCEVAQIAKSLIFRGRSSDAPLLVIASGINRVDERRLAALAGEPIARADADFVRARTGFAIGGIPPLGHAEPLRAWLDEDLLGHAEIWAAAGTPHAVFRLAPADLPALTGGIFVSVR